MEQSGGSQIHQTARWALGAWGAPLCGQHLDLQATIPGMDGDLRSLSPAQALPPYHLIRTSPGDR